ncbi:hypothetical protein EDB92DRAFT_1315534 [Lactarius akahatsu]|uniref:Uncharacterized protein n=1 Tax=Lactarius akahatsu TaxID=416441 RepID=A0AAD4LSI8_9AGAM|nr:hypothetical protein EDB92DRAFT_1315534 [Lactarius akahatsu]
MLKSMAGQWISRRMANQRLRPDQERRPSERTTWHSCFARLSCQYAGNTHGSRSRFGRERAKGAWLERLSYEINGRSEHAALATPIQNRQQSDPATNQLALTQQVTRRWPITTYVATNKEPMRAKWRPRILHQFFVLWRIERPQSKYRSPFAFSGEGQLCAYCAVRIGWWGAIAAATFRVTRFRAWTGRCTGAMPLRYTFRHLTFHTVARRSILAVVSPPLRLGRDNGSGCPISSSRTSRTLSLKANRSVGELDSPG